MKSYMLFGMLLLAGVSFALEEYNPSEWMAYSTTKYGCNFYYLEGCYDCDYYEGTRWDIADDYFDNGNCFDYETMWEYNQDMEEALWGDDGSAGMCTNSGCYSEGEYWSVVGFKSNVLAYNTAALNFNRLFFAGMKECLTNPAYSVEYDREEVFEMLQDNVEQYNECSAMAGYCYGCSVSEVEVE